ncbi:MAG: DUF2156 domain-containing protein [Candidatus Obscuribacterales bacterium]|nr:DUF2156 domain-containing protein [Candidatus Obscuribacterales bacterium]
MTNTMTISAAQRTKSDTAFDRMSYLKRYGVSSLAYSSLQEDVETFLVPGIGYLSYARVGGNTAVVLADPICAAENKKQLIQEFAERFHDPIFVHISRDTAKVLDELHYTVNEIGLETIIDPRSFSLKGQKKEFLRSQRNRARKDHVTVVELDAAHIDMDKVKQLSTDWIKTKTSNHHELSFIVRPAIFADEPDVRKFYAMKDGQIIGFVWFDPIYRDDKVIGYMANILRSNAHVAYSVNDFIIMEAIEKFKAEGIEELSLGYSPFFEINDSGEFHYSKCQCAIFKQMFKHCNHVYAFKALAFHKRMYRPGIDGTREEKIFCASRHRIPLMAIIGIFRKVGLRPVEQTAHFLKEKTKEKLSCLCAPVRADKRLVRLKVIAKDSSKEVTFQPQKRREFATSAASNI